MQIQIETFSGSILDGVILNISGTTMRVVISGCDDAIEVRFHGGIWFWEGRAPVEIQFHERPESVKREWIGSSGGISSLGFKPVMGWVN